MLPWFGTLRALQAQLWSLPFRRVLYLDTDHLPLPNAAERLVGLWGASEKAPLAVAMGRKDPSAVGTCKVLHVGARGWASRRPCSRWKHARWKHARWLGGRWILLGRTARPSL